jgi:hypothetical protein
LALVSTAAPAQVKETAMNALKALTEYGQAVWLDFLARRFVAEGGLARLVEQDGLTGVLVARGASISGRTWRQDWPCCGMRFV